MGRGRLVVRDVRDRRDRPADPVPAGFESLWAGLLCGGVGLLVAGGMAARVHQEAGLVRLVASAGVWSSRHRGDLSCRNAWSVQFFSDACSVRWHWRAPWCSPPAGLATRRRSPTGPRIWARYGSTRHDVRRDGGRRPFGISYDPESRLYYVISDDRSAKNPASFYTARITLSDNGSTGSSWVDTLRCWMRTANRSGRWTPTPRRR